jgi:gluconolactonase
MSQASTLPGAGPAVAAAFISHNSEFAAVLGDSPTLVRVVDVDAHEGPVYAADEDALYFTTLPRAREAGAAAHPSVQVKRVQLDGARFPVDPDCVTTVRDDANVANGMALDLHGRLVACEQGTRSRPAAITRFDRRSRRVERLVEGFDGLPLNSPNDIVVKRDGTLWFTDPAYGHLQGFRPEPQVGDNVYRYDPESRGLTIVADAFDKPNGLAFSPDERILYVGDSGANQEPGSFHPSRPHHIKAFEVLEGCRLANERLFSVTTPGFPDGVKVDRGGRVYASSATGVQVFDPRGSKIGEIALPGAVNFTFGGPDRTVLFITADDAIWAAALASKGPT